ncbi:transcriptional regulator [Cenarchaeum symbiosum A]|uniref:Transcriptional regulator n=1 Tax=Cenarchaeum symbiosum (strain A) TaxID=414004 RepID=A0RUU1_CENSY|nr:transcriptional regulator [Cenarchaeum symbiosum A]
MLPRIDSIRQVRTKLGITQKRLASLAGVSTSMINQIESGRSQPSYETAKRIFDNLAAAEGHSSSHKAGDFCSTDIVKLRPTDTLNGAIRQMQKYGISQIPVFDGAAPAGVVTEDGIVGYMADHGASGLKKTHVSQIMRPVPPIVDYDTPANVLVPLIRFTKCILVSRNSEIVGIVTALDTLKMME